MPGAEENRGSGRHFAPYDGWSSASCSSGPERASGTASLCDALPSVGYEPSLLLLLDRLDWRLRGVFPDSLALESMLWFFGHCSSFTALEYGLHLGLCML